MGPAMEIKSFNLLLARSRSRVAVLGSMTLRVSETKVETERGTLPVRMMKDLGALVEVAALLLGPLRWVRVFLRRLTIVKGVSWVVRKNRRRQGVMVGTVRRKSTSLGL